MREFKASTKRGQELISMGENVMRIETKDNSYLVWVDR